jgi:hypothetical protein
MRIIILLLIILPSVALAQVSRSAKELASDNIREYITEKLFKGKEYKPVWYGEIKAAESKERKVHGMLVHSFEITETELADDQMIPVQKLYRFGFYLGQTMNVLRANGYFIE